MVEETFVANTPKEAYDLAKEKYGSSELELLKAEQIKEAGGSLVSKITIAVPKEQYMESIGVDEEEELLQEIVELKTKMELMKDAIIQKTPVQETSDAKSLVDSDEISDSVVIAQAQPSTPPPDNAFFNIRNIMIKNGISSDWFDKNTQEIRCSDTICDEEGILEHITSAISNDIGITDEDVSRPFMMMLVGSTGVGKTTTIAKLAARYSLLMDRPLKVGLINLDSFRIGAYEQLDRYAKMMQLTHIKVQNASEFGDMLAQMSDYDVVLIDTAGISPYDTDRLMGTIEFLKKSETYDVHTHLVIAATAKRDDIESIYEHFSFLDISNVILTKLDETKKVGEILGFLLENDIKVSYLSSGQNVPDDMQTASRDILLDRFVSELDV